MTDPQVMARRAKALRLHRALERVWSTPPGFGRRSAVNHTVVGRRFMLTALVFFAIGGLFAMLLRTQLAQPLSNFLDDYDFRSPGDGASQRPVVHVPDLADADIAVLRITARKGNYFGLDAGVPLSFDAPFPGTQNDTNLAAAIRDRNRVIDAFRVRDGYTNAAGEVVPATNPNLKIVLVMNMDRPGIVKPFINGLRTLDETPGQPGSYPVVSDEANVNQSVVTTSTAEAKAGVDAFLVDFGAYDRALLDFLFNRDVPPGVAGHGRARLPMEIPSTDAEVEAQFEDVPADTRNPTFRLGAGMNL